MLVTSNFPLNQNLTALNKESFADLPNEYPSMHDYGNNNVVKKGNIVCWAYDFTIPKGGDVRRVCTIPDEFLPFASITTAVPSIRYDSNDGVSYVIIDKEQKGIYCYHDSASSPKRFIGTLLWLSF